MKRRKIKALICLLMTIVWMLAFGQSSDYSFADDFQNSPLYAAAANKSAYFYSEKNGNSSLFAIPYTYCVEILGEDNEWYSVKYADDAGAYRAMYGYCLKKDFTVLDTVPDVVWLYKEVTVKFIADDNYSSLPVLGELEVTAAFYGTYYAGATAYSYVYCEGSFGYISGANDDYPINPSLPSANDAPSDAPAAENETWPVTAVIIAALAAAAIIVLIVSTKRHERIKKL